MQVNSLKGVQAIMYLQAMAGHSETAAEALRGWQALSDDEKKKTIMAYESMKPKSNPNKAD